MRNPRYLVAAPGAALLIAGCALSVNQELELGQQYAAQLDRELPMVHDPGIQADLDRITSMLTPHSRRPEIRYRFRVVNSDAVNAFAVPGGYIYITRALIEQARSLDELSGVLGHEMGHIEHRHSAKQIGRQQMTQLGVGIATVLAPNERAGELVQAGGTVAGQMVLARYSRDQEREADRAGVAFATAAGIDPNGIVSFFEILQGLEQSRPGALESFFLSHPLTEDRIRETNAIIAANPRALALVGTGLRDSPEFRRLKAAVSNLPPPPDRRPARR